MDRPGPTDGWTEAAGTPGAMEAARVSLEAQTAPGTSPRPPPISATGAQPPSILPHVPAAGHPPAVGSRAGPRAGEAALPGAPSLAALRPHSHCSVALPQPPWPRGAPAALAQGSLDAWVPHAPHAREDQGPAPHCASHPALYIARAVPITPAPGRTPVSQQRVTLATGTILESCSFFFFFHSIKLLFFVPGLALSWGGGAGRTPGFSAAAAGWTGSLGSTHNPQLPRGLQLPECAAGQRLRTELQGLHLPEG